MTTAAQCGYNRHMSRAEILRRADREAVEMLDTAGRRHLVAQIPDLAGEPQWCSRKFIDTRGAFSKSWLQTPIDGWQIVYSR